jgi:hypothetical protein
VKDYNFYKDLKAVQFQIYDVLRRASFTDVPDNWYVIIADVKNSTAAVNAGKHNDVNMVAAASLVVALNVAKSNNLEIPFLFGGDGGTVFVPEEVLQEVLDGLRRHNRNTIQNFGLELHVGCMSIQTINEAGHFVKIAKVRLGKGFSKPVIIGDGLKYAEQIIKQSPHEEELAIEDISLLNMEGLECRWDKIKPPAAENEIVCYLIEAMDPRNQQQVYADVLQMMDNIYGTPDKRNPLSMDRLKLLLSVDKIRREMMVRFGKWKSSYLTKAFLKTLIGYLFFRFKLNISRFRSREYLKDIINNADTLTIDGRISTVISGTTDQRSRFIKYLQDLEIEGVLLFGHFISKESVMTCYIENRNDRHIHFVDGADGGYTEASKELKAKLKTLVHN